MLKKKSQLQKSSFLYRQEGRMQRNPALVIIISFVAVILTGTILLTMPFCSRDGRFTSFLSALFTATSATCVTGLAVYDTYTHFSTAGQSVILCLIQIGGLGLVTMTSFFYMLIRRKVGLRTAQLAQESISADSRAETVRLLKMVMAVTFGTELIGCLLMLPILVPEYGRYGIFMAVFLAISAYCNAGFDVLASPLPGGSLSGVQDNYLLLTIIMLLIICGGLGFVVWQDLFAYHRRKSLRFHTRIVLIGTAALLLIGWVVFLLSEWGNPDTLGPMPLPKKLFHAFFQSVTCRTAGFTAFDQGKLHTGSKLFAVLLMFIGAAPGSTGGGVKLTTVLVLFMTVVSVVRGDEGTRILGRRIDKSLIYRSMAVCFLGVCIVLATAGVLMTCSGAETVDALYEAVSAFATVGLTAGVTEVTDVWSKLALILTMFMGRIGPVAFAMSLATRPRTPASRLRREPEGKIWVA